MEIVFPQLESAGHLEDLPASINQKGVIRHDGTGTNAPLIALKLRLAAGCSMDTITEAINRMVMRHSALRTKVLNTSEGFIQKISPEVDLFWETECHGDDAQSRSWLGRKYHEHCSANALDANVPLMKILESQIEGSHISLLINFDHLISDHSSTMIFYKELKNIYENLASGQTICLQETMQYADLTKWQYSVLGTEIGDHAKRYWLDTLRNTEDGAERKIVSRKRPDQSCRIERPLGKGRIEALRRVAKACQVSPFTVMLAAQAVSAVATRRLGDLTVLVPTENRRVPGTEHMFGWLSNGIPLRLPGIAGKIGKDHLQSIAGDLSKSRRFDFIPLEFVRQAVSDDRGYKCDVSRVIFSFVKLDDPAAGIKNDSISFDTSIVNADDFPIANAMFDYVFYVCQTNIGGHIAVGFYDDVISQGEIENILDIYVDSFDNILRELSDFS